MGRYKKNRDTGNTFRLRVRFGGLKKGLKLRDRQLIRSGSLAPILRLDLDIDLDTRSII